MPRDYEKKKAQMRAYYCTEAGQAASKRSKDAYVIKRRKDGAITSLKVKTQPLQDAMANWTTNAT